MGKAIIINDMLFSPNLGSVTITGGDSPEPGETILDLDYLRFPIGVCFNTGVTPLNSKYYQYEEEGESIVNGWRFGSRISATSQCCGYAILDSTSIRIGNSNGLLQLGYSTYSSHLTSGVIKINIVPTAYALLQNEEQFAHGNLSASTNSYPIVLGGVNLAGTIAPNQYGAVNIKSFKVYNNGWDNLIYHVKPVLYDGSPCLYDVINDTIASGWNVSTDTTVEFSLNGTVSTGTLLLGNS